MKQTINIPKGCKAEITGDNIIIEIIPEKVHIKVGDWVKCDKSYILVTKVDSILYGLQFRADNMLYIGECCTHVDNVELRNKEYIEHRLKSERSLIVNDKLEVVPWRGELNDRYEFISWLSEKENTIDTTTSDNISYNSGNYFSEGFLTEERLNEYKETVKKLFNKWRGLK